MGTHSPTVTTFDPELPVSVPDDVVGWRVESGFDAIPVIHLARGNGSYECRYLRRITSGKGRGYAVGDLISCEKEGWDAKTLFVNWEEKLSG